MRRSKVFGPEKALAKALCLPQARNKRRIRQVILVWVFTFQLLALSCFSQENIKRPNAAGKFYPNDKSKLSRQIDDFLKEAAPMEIKGKIFCLISPHAGYEFSGPTAAFGYKLIKDQPYKTVIVIGPSHYYAFNGVSVYREGIFRTPLGDVEIDAAFARKIINPGQNIDFIPQGFEKEHSIEVQLPFLQTVLKDFKVVPIVVGDCSFDVLNSLAKALLSAMASRSDCLVVVSTDLCHSYNYQETEEVDRLTLSYLGKMSEKDIYDGLRNGTIRMCGGFPAVAAIIAAKGFGHTQCTLLHYTNSARVTGNREIGAWTVGYASAIIDQPETGNQAKKEEKSEESMLTIAQKKRLLEIARKALEAYLSNGTRLAVNEDDPTLKEASGAFVTLHAHGALRGCIGNIIGKRPLFETVRDMAIESATADPRFPAVTKGELKDIEIEISVLSPLRKITSIDEFILGVNGVLVRRGFNQGVFLPQVALETGWSKEEFLSNLCLHKAGLSAEAWKDGKTEIFIFSALVFSEREAQ